MKIAYLGNFEAPWCTEVDITLELEALGHDVVRIQEPRHADQQLLNDLERKAGDCAVLFFQRTWGLPPEATQTWRRLEANGTRTASYHLDLYVGLARADAVHRDPFWTTEYVFTPDGNEASAAWFAERDIRHLYMPPAVGSHECHRGTYRDELAHDVVFVGSRGYHPEWPHREELIAWLERTYGDRFQRYGGDTGYTRDGKHVDEPIRNTALNDLYASAKVAVGDSCFARRDQRYFSDRPFETWGRGGYLIFPQIDHLADLIGHDYPSWDVGDWDRLQDLIDGALGDAFHRDNTARVLHDTVRENHTYRQRLSSALTMMGLS